MHSSIGCGLNWGFESGLAFLWAWAHLHLCLVLAVAITETPRERLMTFFTCFDNRGQLIARCQTPAQIDALRRRGRAGRVRARCAQGRWGVRKGADRRGEERIGERGRAGGRREEENGEAVEGHTDGMKAEMPKDENHAKPESAEEFFSQEQQGEKSRQESVFVVASDHQLVAVSRLD